MKKSYHSTVVPTMVANTTRRWIAVLKDRPPQPLPPGSKARNSAPPGTSKSTPSANRRPACALWTCYRVPRTVRRRDRILKGTRR